MIAVQVQCWVHRDHGQDDWPPGTCICISHREDSVDTGGPDVTRQAVVSAILANIIRETGLWTVSVTTTDNRRWLAHFRIIETDEGLDIADELFPATQTNVTRWPPKK